MQKISESTNSPSRTESPLAWVFTAGVGLGLFLGVLVGVFVGRPVILQAPAPESEGGATRPPQAATESSPHDNPPNAPSPPRAASPPEEMAQTPKEHPGVEGDALLDPGRRDAPLEGGAPHTGAPTESPDEPPTASLNKEEIKAAIQAISPAVAACYEEGVKLNPKMAGRIMASFTIIAKNGQGKLDEGEIKESELGNPFVDACILGEIARAEFPMPEGDGVVRVTYPFSFSNQEE